MTEVCGWIVLAWSALALLFKVATGDAPFNWFRS
jgi:hypothetical protein